MASAKAHLLQNKTADVYGKGSLNDVFSGEVDSSIRHSFRHYWSQNLSLHLTDSSSQAKSLLFFRNVADVMSTTNQNTYSRGHSYIIMH